MALSSIFLVLVVVFVSKTPHRQVSLTNVVIDALQIVETEEDCGTYMYTSLFFPEGSTHDQTWTTIV